MKTFQIFDDITSWSVANFISQMDVEKTGSDIILQIFSCGGEVFAAFALIDFMESKNFKVTAQIFGIAASAAAIIALSCGNVEMAQYGSIMLHSVFNDEVENDPGVYHANKLQLEIIKKRMPSFEESDLFTDHWYDAESAIKNGLADRYVNSTNEIIKAVAAFSAYNRKKITALHKGVKAMDDKTMTETIDQTQEDVKTSEDVAGREKAQDATTEDVLEKIVERLDAIEHRLGVLEGEGKKADDEMASCGSNDDGRDRAQARLNSIYARITKPNAKKFLAQEKQSRKENKKETEKEELESFHKRVNLSDYVH